MNNNSYTKAQVQLLSGLNNNSGYKMEGMKPGDLIREARLKRGMSQKALAKAIGISQPAIKKIEAGDTAQSKFNPRIAEELDIELSQLDPSLRKRTPAKTKGASTLEPKPSIVPQILEDISTDHFHDQPNPQHHMPLWNQGDGYRIDEPGAIPDEELRQFLTPYITGGAENKYEIWVLMTDTIEKGDCKAGSHLVVEMGRQPQPNEVVLACTNNKKLPIFRYWVGRILVPAPRIPSPSKLPILREGSDAVVLGVVVDCWPRYDPGAT